MEMYNASMLRYDIDAQQRSEPIVFSGCSDMVGCSVADVRSTSQGRVLELNVRVRSVCPGKRVALAVTVHELDEENVEHVRGRRAMTLPAHHEQSCRDILVQRICFVLPEDISLAEDCGSEGHCGQRRFVARTLAHYVDVGGFSDEQDD